MRDLTARRRVLAGGTVALVAVLGALLAALAAWDRGGSEDESSAGPGSPIAATGTLTPRIVLFGDTLTARVDVVVDRTAVDPEQVTVTWAPAPWVHVRPPEQERKVAGQTAYVRTTFVLRCLTSPCVPARETAQIDLAPARVTYPAPEGESPRRLSLAVSWPTLVVHTRISASEATQRDALAAPWRADLVSLPVVSYRIAPGLALGLLLAVGALLFALAAFVAYRAWPRREPAPEPEPPPPPAVSPLEQALALLESPVAANGAEDRRRALELVADEVERLGDRDLALTARALAWSEDAPEGETTKAFAARLRTRLESSNGGHE